MEDKNKINNNQPIEKNNPKNEESEFGKLSPELEKLEAEWTVEDTMAMCPSLTREEAERAWRMGW